MTRPPPDPHFPQPISRPRHPRFAGDLARPGRQRQQRQQFVPTKMMGRLPLNAARGRRSACPNPPAPGCSGPAGPRSAKSSPGTACRGFRSCHRPRPRPLAGFVQSGRASGQTLQGMSETPRIERMPCGQYPASRHAGVTRQGRDGQGRATRTGRGMAGSGRDRQAPAAAGRIAPNGSGEGRLRPKLERGARLRADALDRFKV